MQKPNIVFVLTDDQGYGDLGCTGNDIVKTPCIDKLYGESLRFTDFHGGPTCAPTRAGLLTGHYHNSTGVWHTIGGRSLLRKDEVSIADIFKENGYATGIFGKWHLGDNYPYRPMDRGFDETVVHGGGGIGQTPDFWGNDYFDDTYFVNGKPKKFEGYCTDVFFNLGIDFICRHKDQPFFCFLATNAPHTPLRVDEKYVFPYKDKTQPDRASFYAMIANIDENIGKLRNKLRELYLYENTIFIFMTDNGTATGCTTDKNGFVTDGYNAGMRGKKASEYEGGHRIPFFLHYPNGGYNKAADADFLSANVDFLPTLIDLCNLKTPKGLDFDGTSLIPAVSDCKKLAGRILVTDNQRVPNPIKGKNSCVMMDSWRLINNNELYDINADPSQTCNLIKENEDIALSLSSEYEKWWARVSRQFQYDIPISIGSDFEITTTLTSHDTRGDVADVAYNQGEVRQGKVCNSYWEIYAEKDGIYSINLRRWPIEEDRGIKEGIDGEISDWFTGGRAIQIKTASIEIGSHKLSKPVLYNDKYIEFSVKLKKGNYKLYAYFTDIEENIINSYYTYVKIL